MRRLRITAVVGAYTVMVGSIVTFVTDTDVVQEHERVRSQRDAIDAMVRASSKTGPDMTALVTSWNALLQQVASYLTQEPSFWAAASQMNTGQSLELDLEAYRKRFAAAGVSMPPAADLPASPASSSPAKAFGSLTTLALIGVAAYVVLQSQR